MGDISRELEVWTPLAPTVSAADFADFPAKQGITGKYQKSAPLDAAGGAKNAEFRHFKHQIPYA